MTTLRAALERLVADLPTDAVVPVRVDHLRELLAGLEPAAAPRVVDRTCAEVATLLARRPSTIRQWCELGRLPGAYRLQGREWRIPAAALAAVVNPPVPPVPPHPLELGGWRAHTKARAS